MVGFAINRLDMTSARGFAQSAARVEQLGWRMGLLPCNLLKVSDPYVSLAQAVQATSTVHLGTLLDTPAIRYPAALASSIATVAEFAPDRTHLGLGIGDTAVRMNGLAPPTLDEFSRAVRMTRSLLQGEKVEVGARKPARLNHAVPVPVWVAAQGPKNLRMAGALADGVWIRLGRHPANLAMAWSAICEGAESVGRNVAELKIGLILHTALCDDVGDARLMAKALAAGYYEYSRFLFDAPGFRWHGEDVHILQQQVYPDFHHRDPVAAGKVVDFLADEVADGFALYGDWHAIATQLRETLDAVPFAVDYVLPHPVLPEGSSVDYLSACAENLIASL